MESESYTVTKLVIADVDVPLTSATISPGDQSGRWNVWAEGVPQSMFGDLWGVLGPGDGGVMMKFNDDADVEHDAICNAVGRSGTVPGFNLSGGVLSFAFDGHLR